MPMPMPMAAGNPLGALRSNKLLLHVLAGALGGIVGALFGEPAVGMDVSPSMRPVGTGLWFGIIASFIAVSLFLSDTWYQRRQIRPERALIAWLCGAAAGFVAGAFAQWVYQQDFGESLEFKNYVLRSICWGIAGAVVGILMSRTIPNLGLGRGAAAGFAGGCVGGLAFIVIAQNLPETLGRAFGLAMLGVALGLAMYIVEKLFRDATLLVIWGPSDSAQFSLGQQPVTIGGDVEDDVHVAGAPPHVISIVLNYGHIEQIDNYTGARTALNNGSQFQVGPVCLVIQARQ